MKFQQYQRIELVDAMEIQFPDEVKDAVRAKQPQTFMDGKVRYSKEDGEESFSLLFPQNNTEVTLQEGDYLVKTEAGIVGESKKSFEEKYGLIEAKAEKKADKKK